ncbi:MAG: hypothetical protein JWO82_847 [Akkermansiaceae bacterium]|nr:hypothetical protein [Akkermansiaceae bacterium]
MNLKDAPEAYLALSPVEQSAVWRTMPRFSPYRVIYWWQVVATVMGSVAASLSYAWYRSLGGTNFFVVMGGFNLLWIGLFTTLSRIFLYRPGLRIGLERATADFLAKATE